MRNYLSIIFILILFINPNFSIFAQNQESVESKKEKLKEEISRKMNEIKKEEEQMLKIQGNKFDEEIKDLKLSEELKRAEMKWELEKKAAQEKAIEDKKIFELQVASEKQWIYIVGIGFVLFIVIFFSVLLLNQYKTVQKQNEIIENQKKEVEKQRQLAEKGRILAEEQKDIIEEKNKKIIDSITYAKRIQSAMLTSESYIKDILSQSSMKHFIYYQPKDIVSGDFYWFHYAEPNLFYVVADSTGHGVPGGFMSMLGINVLNEIVIERGIYDPGTIFNLLRENILKNLKTDDGYSKDGMDAVICKINCNTLNLEYATANNPIYIIRDKNLTEIKPQKMPIGHSKEMLDFETQHFALQKGDRIYTFTDGYADQFGGPNGRKFMYKSLADLLISVHQNSPEKQYIQIKETFENWKGSKDQMDDVCLMGLNV